MPKFRVLETSFIDNKLVQPGQIIDYDGEAAANLEPVKKGAKVDAEPAPDGGDSPAA